MSASKVSLPIVTNHRRHSPYSAPFYGAYFAGSCFEITYQASVRLSAHHHIHSTGHGHGHELTDNTRDPAKDGQADIDKKINSTCSLQKDS